MKKTSAKARVFAGDYCCLFVTEGDDKVTLCSSQFELLITLMRVAAIDGRRTET
jgi:hypothetical protein